ncbi:MAG: DUF192 domain-containing protein [Phycisphaerales bacterium]|nr:DUF192 domain-containing protein [Phycisphaerales bacterium]
MRRRISGITLACSIALLVAIGGCVGTSTGGSSSGDASGKRSDLLREHPLSSLPTGEIAVKDRVIRVWLAVNDGTRAEGLMHVSAEEIADDQGMLFVFREEAHRGFWMRNTIIPLDIAFARFDGTIVRTHRMPPLTLQSFPSDEPAMFALEMKAGAFAALGIREGDRLLIPSEITAQAR